MDFMNFYVFSQKFHEFLRFQSQISMKFNDFSVFKRKWPIEFIDFHGKSKFQWTLVIFISIVVEN